MWSAYQNGYYVVNGHVQPPLVLHSEAELFIAQNAHNLIWEQHWNECSALDLEIQQLRQRGKSPDAVEQKLQTVMALVKTEIDDLVLAEITAYRKSRITMPTYIEICERLDTLERKLQRTHELAEKSHGFAEESRSLAEEAHGLAEEAYGVAEDAQNEAQNAERIAEEAKESAEEVRNIVDNL